MLKLTTIVIHIVSAAIFVLMIYGGGPMGESKMHPWDVVTLFSSLVALILCPLTYACLWKKKTLWPQFFSVFSGILLSVSVIFSAINCIRWFQWPYAAYNVLWNGCVHLLGKMFL